MAFTLYLVGCKLHGITPYCTGGMNMKSVDMLAFGVALALGLAVAQTPREMAIALGVASASLLAKLLMTMPSSNAR